MTSFRASAFAARPRPTLVAALGGLLALLPGTLHAAAVYVDRANPACSDAGPGTFLKPTCTIGAAVLRGGPGVIVFVKPGIYRERVVIPASGASDSAFVIQAILRPGEPVVIDGADDYASVSRWAPFAGNVWLAAGVTVAPRQVFLGDQRLIASTVTPEALPAGSFGFVPGAGLYVNAGGGNPGLLPIAVGARANGFRLTGRAWVEVTGFTVTRCEDKGIYALSGSHHVSIRDNDVSRCGGHGIAINGCADVVVAQNRSFQHGDHGISLTATTRSTVIRNESFDNARPAVRAATGIYLFGATDNRIEANRTHHNQDTGIECTDGADRTLSIQNRSWSNGDHGYDRVRSVGGAHLGDVAWGNWKDGFSLEGTSTGVRVANCIAAMNGTTTSEFNLYVDASSMPGFQSDYNLFSNGGAGNPIKVNNVRHATLAAYVAATGLDAHSSDADPRFAAAAAGDFELLPDSPAIDAADSGVPEWPSLDAIGRRRADAVVTADRGAGSVTYADRGALEYQPPSAPPSITAPSLVSGNENQTLTVTVAAHDPAALPLEFLGADLSRLPAGHQATFTTTADFTGGTLTWRPTWSDSGVYPVTFIAYGRGSSTATTTLRVVNVDRAPVLIAPSSVNATVGTALRVAVTASDPDGDPITALTADLSRIQSGTPVFTVNADRTSGVLDWTPRNSSDARVVFTARNARTTAAETQIRVRRRAGSEDASGAAPLAFAIAGPFPNPTREGFELAVTAPGPGTLSLALFDLQGRRVWSTAHDLTTGAHTLRWDGRGSSGNALLPGLYFLTLRSPFEPGVRIERVLRMR